MHSLALPNLQFPPFLPSEFPVRTEFVSKQLKLRKGYLKNPIFFTTLNRIHTPGKMVPRIFPGNSCLTMNKTGIPFPETLTVAEKVHCLASEFRSLPEPIERLKRLLHYASLLPPFDESARVQENRVTGCTTMVWLSVEMDTDKLMRFKVDSDSEITKGFCSCLIWLLDGAVPEEVLSVNSDDLMEMNVGMPSKGPSRVNTWHNVLSSMQKRTKSFIQFRDTKDRSLNCFPPLVASPDAINGSFEEAQAQGIGSLGHSWLSVLFEHFPCMVSADYSTESDVRLFFKRLAYKKRWDRPLVLGLFSAQIQSTKVFQAKCRDFGSFWNSGKSQR